MSHPDKYRRSSKVVRSGQDAGITPPQRRRLADQYQTTKKPYTLILEQPGALGEFVTKDHVTVLLRVLTGATDLSFTDRSTDRDQLYDLNQCLREFDDRQSDYSGKQADFLEIDYRMISWVVKLIERSFYDGTLANLTTAVDNRSAMAKREAIIGQVAVLMNRLAKIKEQSRSRIRSFDTDRMRNLLNKVDHFSEHYLAALALQDVTTAEALHRDFEVGRDVVHEGVEEIGKNSTAVDLYGMKNVCIAGHYMDRSGKLYSPDTVTPRVERLRRALDHAKQQVVGASLVYDMTAQRFGYERPLGARALSRYGTEMHIRPEVTQYFGFVVEYFLQKDRQYQ